MIFFSEVCQYEQDTPRWGRNPGPADHHPMRTRLLNHRPRRAQVLPEEGGRSQWPVACATPEDASCRRGGSRRDNHVFMASCGPDDIDKREHPPHTTHAQRDDDKENCRKKPQGYDNLIQSVHFDTPFSRTALQLLITRPEVVHDQEPAGLS
jgi:hypothetical protein